MGPAVVLIGIIAVIAIAWFSYAAKQKRREAAARLAATLGLRYAATDPFDIDGSMPHHLFQMGDGRGCENVIYGVWKDVQVTEFDYWYYTTSTDAEGHSSRTYHRFTCVLTRLPVDCAHLIVTPENIMTRLADKVGMHDIDFESEEFNKAWQVKCPDRKFANDFIDQRMMKWLMYAGKDWSFEMTGPNALIYTGKIPTERLETMFECVKAFREHIPQVASSLYPVAGGQATPGHAEPASG